MIWEDALKLIFTPETIIRFSFNERCCYIILVLKGTEHFLPIKQTKRHGAFIGTGFSFDARHPGGLSANKLDGRDVAEHRLNEKLSSRESA